MQNTKKIGKQSYNITGCVSIEGYACVGGKKESEGPLGPYFDITNDDGYFGEKTWEKAESKMQKEAITKAVSKSKKSLSDIDMIFAGADWNFVYNQGKETLEILKKHCKK